MLSSVSLGTHFTLAMLANTYEPSSEMVSEIQRAVMALNYEWDKRVIIHRKLLFFAKHFPRGSVYPEKLR